MLSNQKAQAVLELAILGSLIIMAFSIVIGLSENFNRRQSYMQQTFRATLFKAQDANDSGSVSAIDWRRMPNVTNPMEIGALGQFSSGNSVIWSDGKKKDGAFTEAKQYFLHNRGRYELIATSASGTIPGSVTVSSTSYESGLVSNSGYNKRERRRIRTDKSLSATDSVGGSTTVGDQQVTIGGSLGDGGIYGGGDGLGRTTVNTRNNP